MPASLEGPARNVPEPVMPALAKEESLEGAQAFLDYWSDAKWYAYQTGNTDMARDIISDHCDVCMEELEEIENLYNSDGWAIGGRESIDIKDDVIVGSTDGVYKPVVTSVYEGIKLVHRGKVVLDERRVENPADSFLVYIDFNDGEWEYITAAPMSGS
ncbi:DUF6318 family protein [Kocuria flava]|uniref:DUF6318 family protein n=1 Tax=Kocuria flava TaxID=446860 RepID=UPI003F1BB741